MYSINSKEVSLNKEEFLNTIKGVISNGIRIHDFSNIESRVIDSIELVKNKIYNDYGVENPSSPKQIKEYLEGLRIAEVSSACNKKGKFSADAEALGKLSLLGLEFADDMLKYREFDSIRKALKQLKDNMADGYIYPEANLGKTNRVQYKKPALMSIPKDLLWDLVAPRRDNQSIWSIDIKNQEPNIIANIKNCSEIKKRLGGTLYEEMFSWCYLPKAKLTVVVFTCDNVEEIPAEEIARYTKDSSMYNPYRVNNQFKYNGYKVKAVYPKCISCPKGRGLSIEELPNNIKLFVDNIGYVDVPVKWEKGHLPSKAGTYEISGDILGIDCLNLDIDVRNEFKTGWNALTYGCTKEGLSAICKNIDYKVLWEKFNSLDELRNWREDCKRKARAYGDKYVSSYFGTVMQCEGNNPGFVSRQLMDYEIQGTGADILELLVRHFYDANIDGFELYYTRHDELIILVDNLIWTDDKEVERNLREIFEHRIDDWSPFDIKVNRVS